MAALNLVTLLGNVTREIELRHLTSGTAVCDVGLAVNDRRKSETGEWVDDPVFVDCTCFGRTAEIAGEYLSKGSPVVIVGRLKLDSWTDSSGQKRSKLKVVVDKLQLIGSKTEGRAERRDPDETPAPQPAVKEEDCPF